MRVKVEFKNDRPSRIHECKGPQDIKSYSLGDNLFDVFDSRVGFRFVYPVADIKEIHIYPEQRQSSVHATEH